MSDHKFTSGRQYWRSLDEIKDTPQFREFLEREFPQGADEMDNEWSRRSFITLMGASVALAGLAGCRRPVEKIVPYVTQPEEITLGKPNYYATTMPLGLSAYGLLVTTREGRPIKIHGNPDHPSSLGSSNIFTETSILGLYDPDRSRTVRNKGQESNWAAFGAFWSEQYKKYQGTQGEGLSLLTEQFSSPSLGRLLSEFRKTFPKAVVAVYDPISDENIFEGIRLATGKSYRPVYDYGKADVILSLDSDFLRSESENITASRGFADGRRVMSQSDNMNRLYVAESFYSITGTMADHRLRMKASQIPAFALAVARELSGRGVSVDGVSGTPDTKSQFDSKVTSAIAADLLRARGKSLVVAGNRQPAVVHALVAAINSALGNTGNTVKYTPMVDSAVSSRTELTNLVSNMKAGKIGTLVMLGGNPVYNAPADLDFASALSKVEHTVHLASHLDESTLKAEWHLPMAHYLESWGDARAVDGTVSVIQPMIEPLYGGKSNLEVLYQCAAGLEKKGHDLVRETWQAFLPALDFEKQWRRVLHDGLLKSSAIKPESPTMDSKSLNAAYSAYPFGDAAGKPELVFYPANIFDGRFANNGWLQELPDPLTKFTWDNAALMSQRTADKLGLSNGQMVELKVGDRKIEIPAWICPGHADDSIAVALGYGRKNGGRVADSVGFDAYPLRAGSDADFVAGIGIAKMSGEYAFSQTQEHWSMEGRPLIREASHEEYRKKADFKPEQPEHPPLASMWDEHTYTEGNQWGMVIDLNVCTGCNACAMACQSENNVPVVGKEQVGRGREMHWIRLDRYFAAKEGADPKNLDEPEVVHQPVACQHCEMAPCETVCPVAATTHDAEGLNVMVYNRCIGTRYCSNNCPFKVRRFNFFNYTKDLPETMRMAQNPEVTVRSRGVMEKCTYCLQRVTAAKFAAKQDGRAVADGDIQTACQQACPAKAITFGNINDAKSKVAELKKNDRNYRMLDEFNLRTRTSYLAKLRNPNPELT
ncbi:MAG: TAT-variant-translocated molybdopterin oxidoreductase [candidate division Zixibacteria bacterium]|nr:TAT-variant-translocated molybdopterin oxidoreductase [candidate division Zixibacteria bacterium]